jgi:hypothetical protein
MAGAFRPSTFLSRALVEIAKERYDEHKCEVPSPGTTQGHLMPSI